MIWIFKWINKEMNLNKNKKSVVSSRVALCTYFTPCILFKCFVCPFVFCFDDFLWLIDCTNVSDHDKCWRSFVLDVRRKLSKTEMNYKWRGSPIHRPYRVFCNTHENRISKIQNPFKTNLMRPDSYLSGKCPSTAIIAAEE